MLNVELLYNSTQVRKGFWTFIHIWQELHTQVKDSMGAINAIRSVRHDLLEAAHLCLLKLLYPTMLIDGCLLTIVIGLNGILTDMHKLLYGDLKPNWGCRLY